MALVIQAEVDLRGEAQEQPVWLSLTVTDWRGLGSGLPGAEGAPPGCRRALCQHVQLTQLVFMTSCHVDPRLFFCLGHTCLLTFPASCQRTTRYGVRVGPPLPAVP